MCLESNWGRSSRRHELWRMGKWIRAKLDDLDVTKDSRYAFCEQRIQHPLCYDSGG